ncbi:MAG: hypothetical protein GXO50_06415 [Chlorobi bacterium]|nr:hypothetical protein [Chlorobiota bacterium]
MKLGNYALILCLILPNPNIKAQNDYPYSKFNFNYIRTDKNKILFPGDSTDFNNLIKKINTTILTGEGKIQIIHFGGSHIQAGIYSGIVRKKLQQFFPGLTGGRGMIFPYGMSKTYTPHSYKFKYTGKWETCRNTEHKNCKLGLLGISASTKDSSATITLSLNPDEIKYEINKIRIFHDTGKNNLKIKLYSDSIKYKIKEYPEQNYTLIETEKYLTNFKFKIFKTDTAQKTFTLYGFDLENDFSGITYTDAGISGAAIPSFLRCNLLEKQLNVLKPDLIIISLGTNDTYGKNFSPERYKKHYSQFIEKIKNALPQTAIMLTVPNDCYYKRTYPLPFTEDAEKVILELAKKYNCGVWDFYAVMGGYNSSYLWHKDKLMQNDLIHFTKKGYTIKGKLLFNAILKMYDNYTEKRLKS